MKLVAVLVDDSDPLDWVPQNCRVAAQAIKPEELTDDRSMAINGQSIGLAFARAHRKASEREQNER